jgi:hypothetical protein
LCGKPSHPMVARGSSPLCPHRLWKRLWAPVPSPERFFQSLYEGHGGDFKVSPPWHEPSGPLAFSRVPPHPTPPHSKTPALLCGPEHPASVSLAASCRQRYLGYRASTRPWTCSQPKEPHRGRGEPGPPRHKGTLGFPSVSVLQEGGREL